MSMIKSTRYLTFGSGACRRCLCGLGFAAAAMLVMAALGCHGNRAEPGAPPQAKAAATAAAARSQLAARAEEYWTSQVAEDWVTRYNYAEPKVREDYTLDAYVEWCKTKEPFKFSSYQIFGVEADGDMGWIDLHRAISVRKANTIPNPMRVWEKWRRTDGQWYPVPKNEIDFCPAAPSTRDSKAEDALLDRFDEAWQHKHSGNCDDLFAMLDPRDVLGRPKDEFCKIIFEHRFLERQVLWVEAIGDGGRVRAAYKVKVNDPHLENMPARIDVRTEQWVRYDGRWWVDVVPN